MTTKLKRLNVNVYKLVLVFSALVIFTFQPNVLAADLLEINFQATTNQDQACLTNIVKVLDENNVQQGVDTTSTSQIGNESCSAGGGPLTTFAMDLINAFAQYCNSQITSSNITCIEENIPSSALYPDLAYGEIVQSTNVFGGGKYQCVGFISTVLAGVSGETEFTVGGGGCAAELAGGGPYTPAERYEWIPYSSSEPIQPGDFPIWTKGCGHIAIVINVQGDYAFTAAEALGTNGSTGTRIFQKSQVAGWLREK